jgi:uncharacterized repeat protein (TIGR03803 family)
MIEQLYSFTGPHEACPYSALALDVSGNLYGTTLQDGTFNNGTVFNLDTAHTT